MSHGFLCYVQRRRNEICKQRLTAASHGEQEAKRSSLLLDFLIEQFLADFYVFMTFNILFYMLLYKYKTAGKSGSLGGIWLYINKIQMMLINLTRCVLFVNITEKFGG